MIELRQAERGSQPLLRPTPCLGDRVKPDVIRRELAWRHRVAVGVSFRGRQSINAYWAGTRGYTDWKLEVIEVGSYESPWLLGRSTLSGQNQRESKVDYLAVLKRMPDNSLRYYIDMYQPVERKNGAKFRRAADDVSSCAGDSAPLRGSGLCAVRNPAQFGTQRRSELRAVPRVVRNFAPFGTPRR